MQFDKPKVTIDLEEYQHLKERVEGMDSDQYVIAAKKVIATLLSTKGDLKQTHEYLSKEGIIFSITHNAASASFGRSFFGYDQILISLIDKTK